MCVCGEEKTQATHRRIEGIRCLSVVCQRVVYLHI